MKKEGMDAIAATLTLAALQTMKPEAPTGEMNAQVLADQVVRLYEHIYIRLANSRTV